MVTAPHKMVGLERMMDYRVVGLERMLDYRDLTVIHDFLNDNHFVCYSETFVIDLLVRQSLHAQFPPLPLLPAELEVVHKHMFWKVVKVRD